MKVSILHLVKSARTYFCLAVLLLIAKPFLGFNTFTRLHHPAETNILIKAFAKRKQEFKDDSEFNILAIQKKLADPVEFAFLRFSFLLNILFPAFLIAGVSITNRFLRGITLNLSAHKPSYLLYGNLSI